jgi:tRNA-dihydrouridine synthase C
MPDLPENWLAPLPLPGGKSLPNRIVPGPMEGITLGSFCRVLAKQRLVRCWIAPFIRLTTGVPRLSRLAHRLSPYLDTGLPVVVQIMGIDIDLLAASAQRIAKLGVEGIDLNCGCPSNVVVGNGAGGALLRQPAWIHDAICAIRAACPDLGISVKLRTGFSSPDEMPEILAAVRSAAPDFTILHFRTVAEQYRVVTNGWERLARAKELVGDLPLLASGDLFTVDDALRLWRECRVDGVAPARGLLRNPHLLRDIERACQGESAATDRRAAMFSLLADIAADADRSPDSHHGLVLDFASRALGKDDPIFRQLVACQNLGEATDLLAKLGAVADCASDGLG